MCHLPSGIENRLLLCLAAEVSAVCGFIFTPGEEGGGEIGGNHSYQFISYRGEKRDIQSGH